MTKVEVKNDKKITKKLKYFAKKIECFHGTKNHFILCSDMFNTFFNKNVNHQ